jgi:5-methylthioadenosine/S-adenosylhomocysteine deaminase
LKNMSEFAEPSGIDKIIFARWIVPVIPESVVLEDHAVLVSAGVISAILPAAQVRSSSAFNAATEIIELNDHILLPGLINAHGHAAMSLLRGYADDRPLMTWLQDHIWPAEAQHVCREFVADGSRLAIAEMIRGGTTTFADMYFFPDVSAKLAQEIGIRAQIAFPIFDFPTIWGSGPDEYIDKGLDLYDQYRDSTLVNPVFGPHAPYTVSEPVLARIATLAEKHQCGIQIHVQETAAEITDSLNSTGLRPLDLLARAGLLSPLAQCVHTTNLNESDVTQLADHGAHVVHCPSSNMKLASGTCAVADLELAGVNTALGTDGAASNNSLDMFQEMRTAALLAKLSTGDASALPAPRALAMATINGARALGMEDSTGSLEPGKAADMIAVDTRHPGSQPVYDVISQLVYATGSHQVSHSWVAGKSVLEEGELTGLQSSSIIAAAESWRKSISQTQS